MSIIGDNIRVLRRGLSLNQTEFARRIGLSQSGIAGYERGERSVDDRTMKLICREFGVSESWLRTGEGEMREKKPDGLLDQLAADYNMNATEVAFFEAYLQLPDDQREVLRGLLDRAFDLRADRLRAEHRALGDELAASTRNADDDLDIM